MRYGVIYSFDTERTNKVKRFYPRNMKLFEVTEGDSQGDYDEIFGPKSKHRKLVSKNLLSQVQFDRFIDDVGLRAQNVETMGSIIGFAWGLGAWTVPAISFDDNDGQDYIANAYVTPIPDVELTREPDDHRMERAWERVRLAVINKYR